MTDGLIVALALGCTFVGFALGLGVKWKMVLDEDEARWSEIDADSRRHDWIKRLERRRELRRRFERGVH